MTQAAKRTWANVVIVLIAVALGSVTNGLLSNVVGSTANFFSSSRERPYTWQRRRKMCSRGSVDPEGH